MKHLKEKLWVKILCYILFFVFSVLVLSGIIVNIELIERGYFTGYGNNDYMERIQESAESQLRHLATVDLSDDCTYFLNNPELQNYTVGSFASYYRTDRSNLCFTITDNTSGAKIAENYQAKNRLAETRLTMEIYIPLQSADIDAILNAPLTGSQNDWLLALAQPSLAQIKKELAESKETATDNTIESEAQKILLSVPVTVEGYVNADFSAMDDFYWQNRLHRAFTALCPSAVYITLLALLGGIFCLCFLMTAAGHRAGAEGIALNWSDRIPLDLYLLLLLCLFGILCGILDSIWYDERLLYGVFFSAAALTAPAVCMSVAARIKARQLFQNTFIFKLICLCKRYWHKLWQGIKYAFRRLPLFWKSLLAFAGLSFMEFLCIAAIAYNPSPILFFWFLEKLAVTPLLIFVVLNLQALKKGAKAIAGGNLHHKISTRYMFWEFKNHAEQLNSIGDGMQKAVEAQLKNERMKTELITNVSHDIKTPLTSIINYVDLLKKEDLGNETAAAYLEVLDRQSARLKKLTEDLVEASKADTGNIPVHFEKIDVSVLLGQVTGEYEERLAAKNLQIVPDIRSHAEIMADGRLLQRIFENLLGNICKYAMENTRVYLTCEDDGNEVQISFKNISKYPLNITSDELTERFVRGDSSRNTEGSGLGLSIAKSLTKLQNAQMHLYIDGDLFKAMIRFKIVK